MRDPFGGLSASNTSTSSLGTKNRTLSGYAHWKTPTGFNIKVTESIRIIASKKHIKPP